MDMAKYKTSELTGVLLDAAVALAEGLRVDGIRRECIVGETPQRYVYAPSGWWSQGGPIIEREGIGFRPISDATWEAESAITAHTGRGPTPLIAAMRAHVAGELGDEVELPA
jgi:hypothetical protein